MRLSKLSELTKRAFRRVKESIIEDCPPELYECEICRKLDCDSEEWLKCEKRLASARFMKSWRTRSDCSYLTDPKNKQDVPNQES